VTIQGTRDFRVTDAPAPEAPMHRPYRFPRTRICTDELLALFGMEVTRNLVFLGGGRRIPTQQHFRAALRRLDVANDWRRG